MPGIGYDSLPTDGDWYEQGRRLAIEQQNPIRTYTVRKVRPELAEVDIDLVLHGSPAEARLACVCLGGCRSVERVGGSFGQNCNWARDHGGTEFRPPAWRTRILCWSATRPRSRRWRGSWSSCRPDSTGVALFEMPHPGDVIDIDKPSGVDLVWLIRGDREVGEPTLERFAEHATMIFGQERSFRHSLDDDEAPVAREDQLLWDVGVTPTPARAMRGWLARLARSRRCAGFL